MKKRELSSEMHNAIVWLERQPGITSVVKTRYNRTRHKHAPGFTRVVETTDKQVRLRTFDKLGCMDLYVHAAASPIRDKWIATVVQDHKAAVDTALAAKKADVAPSTKKRAEESANGNHVPQPDALLRDKAASQIFDVTPELAMMWLERNTRNRKLRQSVVNRYAADMRNGKWKISTDAIGFDTNGCVINGQHRLWAVIEANVTIQLPVMFNLDPDVVAVLDDHLKRNTADVAGIRKPGTAIQGIHTAVANMLLQTSILLTATDRRAALDRITRQAQLDSIDRHWDAIHFAFRECFRSRKMRGITVAAVLTPVARAYYTQDHTRLQAFGEVLLTGIQAEGSNDQPAILLRNYLTRFTDSKPTPDIVYRKAERALDAFIQGQKLGMLYEAPTELFPLPDERPARKR